MSGKIQEKNWLELVFEIIGDDHASLARLNVLDILVPCVIEQPQY